MSKKDKLLEFDTEEEENDSSTSDFQIPGLGRKDKSITDLFRDFRAKKIELTPDFQRGFIWNKRKQDELIKSLWRGIPIPTFYFSKNKDGSKDVIDGQQRLTTIFGFMERTSIDKKNRNKLSKKVKILDQKGNEISKTKILNRIKNDSNFSCVSISDVGLNINDRYEIFRALNQNATPLKAQEIKNALFEKKIPWLNKALRKNAKKLHKLVGMKNERMKFEEYILRFFVINEKGYDKRVSSYLSVNWFDKLILLFSDEKEVKKLSTKFNRLLRYTQEWFGDKAFQVLSGDSKGNEWGKVVPSGTFNQGLFHLFSYYIPKFDNHQLNKKSKKMIRKGYLKILKNNKFQKLISGQGTDATKKIIKSIKIFENLFVKKYLGEYTKKDRRVMPKPFKKVLLAHVGYCYLCYGKLKKAEHLEDFKDIHGDHIKTHKLGYKAEYYNILLTHRACNSDRLSKKLEEFRKTNKSIKKRFNNKKNINSYIKVLTDWNTTYHLSMFNKLVRFAKEDKKLKL